MKPFRNALLLWSCGVLVACTTRSNERPAGDGGAGGGTDGGGTGLDAAMSVMDGGPPGPARDAGMQRLPDGAWVCGGEEIVLERLPARLVFVVDRSSSTLEPADPTVMPTAAELGSCADTNARPATGITYRTLWDDLGGAVAEVAVAREDRVSFGLTVFPGPGALTGAASPDAFCTSRPPTTLVAPGPRTASAIRDALTSPANAPLCSGGFTPTRSALEVAGEALSGAADGVLVLATDGAPNCGSAGRAGCTCTTSSAFCGALGTIGCLDDTATLAAITALRARGIRTYVVGIPGTESYGAVLSAMADAGGTARTGAERYYRADDAPALLAALGTISDREVSCRFALASPPPDRTNVNVLLDDVPAPRSDTDGWQLAEDGGSIELRGPTCERLRTGAVGRVQFLFGCPPLI